MGRELTGNDLLDELDACVNEAKRTAQQARDLFNLAGDRMVTREAAEIELQRMSERMLARSQAMSRLINDFLASPVPNRQLAEWAKDLVADAKADMDEARGQRVFTDVQDLNEESDTFH
jgi:hypothetical protein